MPWWKKAAQAIADAAAAAAQAVAAAAAAAAQAAAAAAAAAAQAVADAAAAAAAAVQAAGEAAANAADAAAQAVADAANAAANAVGDAIESAGNTIADAIADAGNAVGKWPVIGPALGGFLNLVGRFVAGATQVIATGLRATVNMSIHAIGGLIRIVGGGVGGLLAWDGKVFVKGWREIADAVVGGTLATVATVVGMVQATLFIQRRERPLTEYERGILWRVYRGSVALGNIRIVEGTAGLFSLSSRPFTMGNWIYAKGYDLSQDLETLVHECAHVWQNQHEGTIYIGNAVLSDMFLTDAYDWKVEQSAGKVWQDFNKEAQAEFIDDVFQHGSGSSATGPGTFYEDDPLGAAVHFQPPGSGDLTAFARTSVAYMRAA